MDCVKSAFGQYAQQFDSSFITCKSPDPNVPTTVLNRIRTARIVFSSEVEKGSKINSKTAKMLTGQDAIPNGEMCKEMGEAYTPQFTPILTENVLAEYDEPGEFSTARRSEVHTFETTFDNDNVKLDPPRVLPRDNELPERMKGWRHAWLMELIDGYIASTTEGLEPPEDIVSATMGYLTDGKVAARFVEEMLIKIAGGFVYTEDLKPAWNEFVGDDHRLHWNGCKAIKQVEKAMAVQEHVLYIEKTARTRTVGPEMKKRGIESYVLRKNSE